ncbi:MAG TPA: Na+/H+ antiporter NhaA [Vicinamibacterales bacterium]|nr:Na+/H+ antiporter NhaA [Vicinamibacterales bacterium]
MAHTSHLPGPLQRIVDTSLLLILGTVVALVWANLDIDTYHHYAHLLHFAANDVGMVFFFALATKEVFEATLPGGPLASPRQAAVPVIAAIGGMVVPAGVYLAAAYALDHSEMVRGWAIPTATDIAFSYLVARIVFPRGHSAIPFLLLLAIADDAMGLIILAVFYPSGELLPGTLLALLLPAMALAYLLRRNGVRTFWAYVLGPGVLSWAALFIGGLHPALALVPIVPFMPHGKMPIKPFVGRRAITADTMNEFEHWWKLPVQFALMIFGFANAGVPLSAVGFVTWVVLASLVIGKPLGIVLTSWVAARIGLERASDLSYPVLVVVGVAAGIGFTVALFFATAAFPAGLVLDEAKMGALLSFFAAPLAIVLGRLLRVRR